MELHEFNSPPTEIDIDGTIVEFDKFRLLDKAWAVAYFATKENPNGLEVLSEKLKKVDTLAAAALAWRLVKNKRDISKKEFFDMAEDPKNFAVIYKAIIDALEQSEPTKQNARRLADLKKS